MGHPTKIQLIERTTSEQWYVNFPAAIAQAMELEKGEVWEWIVEDKNQLVLRRQTPAESSIKKN
jgi:bifunctional DNA-binding transcriptional regulator/antitoxin component of YhaV-PrlF toxin-antitoxin module